jgi:HK97 family phage portal protein
VSFLNRALAAWQILTRQGPPGPADDPLAWARGWNGSRSLTGLPISARGALNVPTFSACVSLISQALASEDWKVVRKLESGGTEPVESEADQLLDLLDFATKERFCADALLSGNGFLYRTDAGLTALPWESMSLQWTAGPNAPPPIYWYFDPLSATQIQFAFDDLCHLRYRNYGRYPWLGMPPLIASADPIALGIASRVVQAGQFQNAARISGYLTTPGKIDKQKANEMAMRWNQNYAGADAAGKTAVLEQGLEWKSLDIRNLAELQMAELQKSNDQDIARCFNVPSIVLGEIQSNRANSQEASRMFAMLCLAPFAKRVASALELYLLSEAERQADIGIDISLRDLTQGHGSELSTSLSALTLAGIISRNEARASLGLVAVDELSQYYQPVNVETLDQAQNRNASNAADATAPTAPDVQAEGLPPGNVVPLRRFDAAYLDELERLIDEGFDDDPAQAAE